MRFLIFTFKIMSICVLITGCSEKSIFPSLPTEPEFARATKLAKDSKSAGVHVSATVLSLTSPNERVRVRFAKSVAGVQTLYQWEGMADTNGVVELTIESPLTDLSQGMNVNGYYVAQALNVVTNEIVGQWSSIPLNQSERAIIYLPIGERAYKITPFIQRLLDSPTELKIDRQEIIITSVFFDVGRVPGPDYRPEAYNLRGAISFRTTDLSELPHSLNIDHIIVVNRDDVWEGTPAQIRDFTFGMQASVFGGPKWRFGSQIDIIIQLSDGNRNTYLLKASPKYVRPETLIVIHST